MLQYNIKIQSSGPQQAVPPQVTATEIFPVCYDSCTVSALSLMHQFSYRIVFLLRRRSIRSTRSTTRCKTRTPGTRRASGRHVMATWCADGILWWSPMVLCAQWTTLLTTQMASGLSSRKPGHISPILRQSHFMELETITISEDLILHLTVRKEMVSNVVYGLCKTVIVQYISPTLTAVCWYISHSELQFCT
jgi:hypothetical protein